MARRIRLNSCMVDEGWWCVQTYFPGYVHRPAHYVNSKYYVHARARAHSFTLSAKKIIFLAVLNVIRYVTYRHRIEVGIRQRFSFRALHLGSEALIVAKNYCCFAFWSVLCVKSECTIIPN